MCVQEEARGKIKCSAAPKNRKGVQVAAVDDAIKKLNEWEQRKDHDIGPGLMFVQAWIQLFSDCSGYVTAELSTQADECGDDRVQRLLTVLGIEGTIERRMAFDTLDEAILILSEPLKI